MKRVAALMAYATIVFAADPQPPQRARGADTSGQKLQVRKLGNVTWQPETHVLSWIVDIGTLVDGRFVSESQERYEVSPEEAFMGVGNEQRGIEGEEAVSLHRLLDTLALYCVQSVSWWERGEGVPIAPGEKRPKAKHPSESPQKESAPEARPVRVAAKIARAAH